jgi:hypothetical protein
MFTQRQAQWQQRQAAVYRRIREHALESFRISMHDDQERFPTLTTGKIRQDIVGQKDVRRGHHA